MPGLQLIDYDINMATGRALAVLANAWNDVLALNNTLNDADRIGGAAGLQSRFGFTASDAGLIIASYTDIAALWDVARARRTQPAVNDFWYNAKRLIGPSGLPT
jgi:hypothetical protein